MNRFKPFDFEFESKSQDAERQCGEDIWRHQNGMGGGGCSVKTKPESADLAMKTQQAQRGAECTPGAGSQELN